MQGIKIPLQDFVLKMQGPARGHICGTLRYFHCLSMKMRLPSTVKQYMLAWSKYYLLHNVTVNIVKSYVCIEWGLTEALENGLSRSRMCKL